MSVLRLTKEQTEEFMARIRALMRTADELEALALASGESVTDVFLDLNRGGIMSTLDSEQEKGLALIRQLGGIRVYPASPDPNQQKLAAACLELVEAGLLESRPDGDALLVWTPATASA
jgi:hypothetical protein